MLLRGGVCSFGCEKADAEHRAQRDAQTAALRLLFGRRLAPLGVTKEAGVQPNHAFGLATEGVIR